MKRRVAIVTVELLLESGYPNLQLNEAIDHVKNALDTFRDGKAPLSYSDSNIIDARLVRER